MENQSIPKQNTLSGKTCFVSVADSVDAAARPAHTCTVGGVVALGVSD